MNKLAIAAMLLALAGCGQQLGSSEIAVPTWACSQNPSGASRVALVDEYCGKACNRKVPKNEYEVVVKCEYVEWRR